MRICNLGQTKLVKFCFLSTGTLFSTVDSLLNVDHANIYMKLYTESESVNTLPSRQNCVNVADGKLNIVHPSSRVYTYPNSALVLDYIDRS